MKILSAYFCFRTNFIFNREWFERFDPDERLATYHAEFATLTRDDRIQLVDLLSSCDPRGFAELANRATTSAP